ncbi:hypothetical protein AB6G22_20670 [Providencia hangzhouensis]|uniref:hypothetical protein n=1 Tax=Providencia hangzhouensis TaxID=3031799 RepID=UPI0034DD045C
MKKNLSKRDLQLCQEFIETTDFNELNKKALTVEQWIEKSRKKRENYKKEREKFLYVNCA